MSIRIFVFVLLAIPFVGNADPNRPVGPVKPVLVLQDDAERFQIVTDLTVQPGQQGSPPEVLIIPPGKRLIIDHVSADVRTSDTQRAVVMLSLGPVTSAVGGSAAFLAVPYFFSLQDSDGRISTGPSFRVWYLSQQVELWAETFARVMLVRGPSLDGSFPDDATPALGRISISGRIVDSPPPK